MIHSAPFKATAALAPSVPYPVIYRNLMSVALLGTVYRVGSDADTISQAVEATLEDSSSYLLYRNIVLAMAGQRGQERDQLLHHVENHPEDGVSKVALALTLLFEGDPAWRHWIDNVLATSMDQPVRHAAQGILHFLGKAPKPVIH
ncbi:HrpB1 family type III secretion system apparatus protein [Acidovorax sp. GBBC 3334]|uniref:hypothetical protein n=1 Tax=unclassified Acidovorax TaxID=2684926 RepID=UPI002304BD56|nr:MULTISPECIES: hypothetical protein [unclassified Acidovorax]MDA8457422.1 HrpB1 family type III secretion system apparatus protein [Acidovorax sp. GBBC 3334]MDA8522811.1 HrpB1 family type III secretion system apparatus protein [Acidovorax sp. NCPPB 4044]